MPHLSRRQFAFLLSSPLLLAGCARGAAQKIALEDVSALATDALLVALLGPPENRMPAMGTPEPPILVKGSKETVVLSTDYAAFVKESRGALTEADIKALEAEVAKRTAKILQEEGFTLNTASIGVAPPADPAKSLLAVFTPAVESGGSPADKRAGLSRSLLLIRLTVSDPQTKTVLRVREFYSGRDVGVRP
ncbi:MAG: hypothetical protein H7Y38_11820 [Armatimonadetes bacterium]|nr:hypothetical protein [Armatimonadota bacterium]